MSIYGGKRYGYLFFVRFRVNCGLQNTFRVLMCLVLNLGKEFAPMLPYANCC